MRKFTRTRLVRVTTVALAFSVCSAVAVGTAEATPTPSVQASATGSAVHPITDRLARALAVELANPTTRLSLTRLSSLAPLDPSALDPGGRLAATLGQANTELLAAKGLPAGSANLLRIRLGHQSMLEPLRRGAAPVVAATPDDDLATAFTAYEPGGRAVSLATSPIPRRPVIFVDVDVDTATAIGLRVLRQETTRRGLSPAAQPARPLADAGGFWATKITRVRVHDVEEPWFKGAAEIFSLVAGFAPDGHVQVDSVDMPYLDDADHDYFPNQLLVYWNRYRYNAADVVMMEDDGDTNYLALATAISTALLTIVDAGSYTPLVTAVLNAIPTSWWTDDPDYVDSWYTLTMQSSGALSGAAGNGTLQVTPFFVTEI